MRNREIREMGHHLATGEIYHIFSKSIAKFKIFNKDSDFIRMRELFRYYQVEKPPIRFSYFSRLKQTEESEKDKSTDHIANDSEKKKEERDEIVVIIGYCIMVTHFHLILKQLTEKGISIYMNKVLNSYTRYFNTKYKRKGPLWETRFKRVWVRTDEQLLHLTRYIHLNPATAYLVEKPEDWPASSYKEYLREENKDNKICSYKDVLDISPSHYKRFVEDTKDYQRQLAKIKELILEDPENHTA